MALLNTAMVDLHPSTAKQTITSSQEQKIEYVQPVTGELLSDSNATGAHQTWSPHQNGSSEARGVNADYFMGKTPTLPEFEEFFKAIEKWEGYVVSVSKDSFVARITSTSGERNIEQEAQILIEEITESDRSLIQPGAVFYWSIGYLDRRVGGRLTTSIIRFRRLPVWTNQDLRKARTRVAELKRLLHD